MINKEIIDELISWIRDYVNNTGAKGVTLGMSGGKDSMIVAKLCTLALGEENVFGVIMPNGEMIDKSDAVRTCELLNIPYTTINIKDMFDSAIKNTENALNMPLSSVTTINTAPRIRMMQLYAIAGTLNYLVANTSNLSEASVGYCTKWGDNVGDFAPLLNFTKTEVCEIGLMLGLPDELVNKIPSDGLTGKSDETKLGFSYFELDNLIRNNVKGENYDKIVRLNKITKHKRDAIARFNNNIKNYL